MRHLFCLVVFSLTAFGQDSSVYVRMKDGTRLAVDVYLPEEREEDETFPALFELTRYWRSTENATTGRPNRSLAPLDRHLLANDYALVKVDVRGTGASFGTRPIEYGRQEVRDGHDVVEWVVAQAWCSGAVGAYGTSYTGTTAELLTAVKHAAVKAVIPGWSDFDIYRSPARPYGLHAKSLIDTWGELVGWMDENSSSRLGAGVRRVNEDADGSLLEAAVAEHAANVDVADAVAALEFRDQTWAGDDSYAHCSSLYWKGAIEESAVPMLVFASWLDAGTADGALRRFQHYSNPQKVVILASNHGGGLHASPFAVGGSPVQPRPSQREQFELRVAFLDHYLKGMKNGVEAWPAVRYFNLGEEAYRETEIWPPAGMERRRLYFRAEGGLSFDAPRTTGVDEYAVDFGVSTGTTNRWSTQMGGPVLNLDDRGAMDERMLVYTSAPLTEDLQVTGTPVAHLRLTSDHADGAVLVYLEDVDPDGRSRYVTEGGLRFLHRKLSRNPAFEQVEPFHSFAEADALPLVPGEEAELAFELWPTSVLFRAGHRIRVAIAGADADSFARVPAQGTPTLRIGRSTEAPSFVELPVIE